MSEASDYYTQAEVDELHATSPDSVVRKHGLCGYRNHSGDWVYLRLDAVKLRLAQHPAWQRYVAGEDVPLLELAEASRVAHKLEPEYKALNLLTKYDDLGRVFEMPGRVTIEPDEEGQFISGGRSAI